MRTNIFNQMTAREIEDYLASGKDAIFVAVGSTGAHGNMPVNAKSVLAEGLAKLLAEKADAIAFTDLCYFYPGETVISSASVYTSLRDNFEYLWKILTSLINQGFKELFIVTCDDNINLMLNAFTRDFFEGTHYHPIIINLMNVLTGAEKHDSSGGMMGNARAEYVKRSKARLEAALPNAAAFDRLVAGAYKIMGKENQLVVCPNAKNNDAIAFDPAVTNFVNRAKSYGGTAAEMYDDPSKFVTGLAFTSVEERDEVCADGETKLRNAVNELKLDILVKVVREYQEYSLEVCEKFPRFGKLAGDR